MICLSCRGPLAFPPYGHPLVCVPCGARYRLVQDLGYFTYTIEVYEPATEDA